jgi:hypothetical protein
MKKMTLLFLTFFSVVCAFAQSDYNKHPNISGDGWTNLFNGDLTNAIYAKEVWSVNDGVFTATKDSAI